MMFGLLPMLLGPRANRPPVVLCGTSFLHWCRDDGAPHFLGLPPATTDAERTQYAVIAEEGQEPVWMYETRFARQNLVADGRMLEYKFRGIWEISKKGRDWLALFRTPPRLRQRHLFDGLGDLDDIG